MTHLNVDIHGGPRAACGRYSLDLVTDALDAVTCSHCRVALDLMLDAGAAPATPAHDQRPAGISTPAIAVVEQRVENGRLIPVVRVDRKRAFPYAPAPCPHRYIAARHGWPVGMTIGSAPVNLGAWCDDCGAGPLPSARNEISSQFANWSDTALKSD